MSRGNSDTEKADSNKNRLYKYIDNNHVDIKYNFLKGYYKLFLIILIFTIIILFRSIIIDRVIVSGNSMCNTINNGDMCWVKKSYNKIKRGDIVIAKVGNKFIIKRVIGLPEELITIKQNKVYVNDCELKEPYSISTQFIGIKKEYKIKKNEYFLLGDNRDDSVDSRVFGAIKKDKIKGVVVFRFYPFTKIGKIGKVK